MKRAKQNFLVDTLAFAAFVFLTTTGVLVRWVLPPGSGRWTTLWGMDRHEWGDVHFWVAVVLLAICALHLLLHWRWIVSVVRGRPREGSGMRVAIALVAVLALLGLALAPLFTPVRTTGGDEGEHGEHEVESAEDHSIRGSMTLAEVSKTTGVPLAAILEGLGLPPDLSPDEQLGQLRREHGFEMEELRALVESLRER